MYEFGSLCFKALNIRLGRHLASKSEEFLRTPVNVMIHFDNERLKIANVSAFRPMMELEALKLYLDY